MNSKHLELKLIAYWAQKVRLQNKVIKNGG